MKEYFEFNIREIKLLHLWIFMFYLLISCSAFSQFDSTNQSSKFVRPYRETALKFVLGGSLQQAYRINDKEYSRKYFEIGLHRTITIFGGQHPPSSFTHGLSFEIAPESSPIYGFKYSAWAQVWCLVLGLGGIYYTDFNYGNFKIRPEFGFGMYPFKLTAGFNIPTIQNKEFKKLQKSQGQITLSILLKLKTIKKELLQQ
jgi:hypothetical protein